MKRLLIALSLIALQAHAAPRTFTLRSGEVDRHGAVVEFETDEPRRSYTAKFDDGGSTPCTSDGTHGWFIVDDMKAGQARRFVLQPAADVPTLKVTKDAGELKVTALRDQREVPVLTYQSEKTELPAGYDPVLQRGGYLSPVFTPAGKLLTDDYPPNHKHHHGIWSPWTKTEFEGRHPDFWNMQEKTGRVDPAGVVYSWSGTAAAGLRAKHDFIDMTAKPEKTALHEQWDLVVYPPAANYNLFDLTITQNALDVPLTLPKYHYGGLGFRGRRDWDGNACEMITSEGKTRTNGDEARARWVWVGGKADGADCGMAILCHPSNFRAPQPIRLHPSMPYVSYTPSNLGDWKIEPGKPYVARYRLAAVDGPLDSKMIDRLWRDYAEPPTVTTN